MSRITLSLLLVCLIGVSLCQDYGEQEHWGGDCQTGKRQSPINIRESSIERCQPNFSFKITSKDDTYTQIAYDPHNENLKTPYTLSTITVNDNGVQKVFNAIQFHFHHRSEHHINNREYDLELHVVHQAADKSLAVFGILFQVHHGTFSDPFDTWNLDTKTPVQQKLPIDLETPRNVFHYKGSLTTPDCTEGVQWFVSEDVIKIKESSLEKVAELINEGHPNDRKIQPINGRHVYESGQVCSVRRPGGRPSYHKMLRHD